MKIRKNIKSLIRAFHSIPSGKVGMGAVLCCLIALTSCSEIAEKQWDPYYDWKARNAAWYEQIADSARTAIAAAQTEYGDTWEEHCDWRMYRSLLRSDSLNSSNVLGSLTDSICVHIRQRGAGTVSPIYNDTVNLSFRGWLMPTEYEQADGSTKTFMAKFTETFYGTYNPETAKPQIMLVYNTIEGFSTALQYMVEGDVWDVYIPQQLGYKNEVSNAIPAYSTLLFRLYMRER